MCIPSKQTQSLLKNIQDISQETASVYELTQEFVKMVRELHPEKLAGRLKKARYCVPQEIRGFAEGLERERLAMEAALMYHWSNGPVEGHVNRLKFIKRQMYGQANFDLLRSLVLYPG